MIDHTRSPMIQLSSDRSPADLHRAIDGREWTRWASGPTAQLVEDRAWLAVDLGGPTELCMLSVHWERASAHSYSVLTSTDGQQWTSQTRHVSAGGDRTDQVALPAGLTARHIKLALEVPNTVWGYAIWELRVFGVVAPPRPPQTPPPTHPPSPPNPPPVTFFPGPKCVNGAGQTLTLSSTTLVECSDGITVQGTLSIGSDVYIRTPFIHVEPSGTLLVGTEEAPASNVTIFLEHDDCWPMDEGAAKERCLEHGQLLSYGTTRVWGQPKASWTWLAAEAAAGASTITVEDCTGWLAGDWIVLGPTGHGMREGRSEASESYIASVSAGGSTCTVALTVALPRTHHCAELNGVRKVAEVSNLKRAVEITGAYHWRDETDASHDRLENLGGQGIVTSQRLGGLMTMSHAHVRNCGRIILGEYCLHLHLMGRCPECRFDGVVVTESANKALVFHGTHQATAQDVVIYGHRGASVYMQNGVRCRCPRFLERTAALTAERALSGTSPSDRQLLASFCSLTLPSPSLSLAFPPSPSLIRPSTTTSSTIQLSFARSTLSGCVCSRK